MLTSKIDADVLLKALLFYQSKGYVLSSCDYLVDEEAIMTTLVDNTRVVKKHLDKCYVGSAEQSYIQKLINNTKYNTNKTIIHGDFLFITPCHRDETILDDTHFEIFLKVELISTYKNPIHDAISFYETLGVTTTKVITEHGDDLEINGIEVGSFGKRKFVNVEYFYGTGIAFPRFHAAVNIHHDI